MVSVIWWLFYLFFVFPKYYYNQNTFKYNNPTIIVLTGGKGRFELGLDLLRNSNEGKMFISGVYPKIDMKKKYLKNPEDERYFDCCIFYGLQAKNTLENVQEVKKWIESNKTDIVYLVTSYYHLPRVKLIFEKTLPNIKLFLVPSGLLVEKNKKKKDSFFEFKIIIKEFFKILYLLVFGF